MNVYWNNLHAFISIVIANKSALLCNSYGDLAKYTLQYRYTKLSVYIIWKESKLMLLLPSILCIEGRVPTWLFNTE